MKLRNLRLEIGLGLLTAAALLFVFAELAEGLLADELTQFDALVGGFIRGFVSDRLTPAALLITSLGTAYVYVGVLLIIWGYLWKRQQKRQSVVLAVTLAGAAALNLILKEVFKRSRPDIARLAEAGGYSFPSGHSMVSAAFYGMVGYLLWRNLRRKSRPAWFVPVLTVVLVLLIGVSRIYLGVHYPSDVIAGFAAGGVWLLACIAALHAFHNKRSPRNPRGSGNRLIRR